VGKEKSWKIKPGRRGMPVKAAKRKEDSKGLFKRERPVETRGRLEDHKQSTNKCPWGPLTLTMTQKRQKKGKNWGWDRQRKVSLKKCRKEPAGEDPKKHKQLRLPQKERTGGTIAEKGHKETLKGILLMRPGWKESMQYEGGKGSLNLMSSTADAKKRSRKSMIKRGEPLSGPRVGRGEGEIQKASDTLEEKLVWGGKGDKWKMGPSQGTKHGPKNKHRSIHPDWERLGPCVDFPKRDWGGPPWEKAQAVLFRGCALRRQGGTNTIISWLKTLGQVEGQIRGRRKRESRIKRTILSIK